MSNREYHKQNSRYGNENESIPILIELNVAELVLALYKSINVEARL